MSSWLWLCFVAMAAVVGAGAGFLLPDPLPCDCKYATARCEAEMAAIVRLMHRGEESEP